MPSTPLPTAEHSVGVKDPAKNLPAALLYLIILGQVGGHMFYLRRWNSAFLLLTLGIVGWASCRFVIGWMFLAILWCTILVDLFRLPRLVGETNLRFRMYQEL